MSYASAGGFAMPCASVPEPSVARIGAADMSPNVLAGFAGRTVRIWSDQRGAWWRPAGHGYTVLEAQAGEFTFDEALSILRSSGPEKRLFLDILA